MLGRLLRLAYEHGKLGRLPLIHKPKEAAPREGFERAAYEAVRRNLPVNLQVAVTITYTFGWRTQSEILPLERRQVDLEAGTLRLDDRYHIVTPADLQDVARRLTGTVEGVRLTREPSMCRFTETDD